MPLLDPLAMPARAPLVAAPRAASAGTRALAIGLGCSLPERAVSSQAVARAVGVDEAWILRRTGIRSRRHAPPSLTLCELAARSALAALDDATLAANEVELLVLATVSQEQRMPNVAPQVAAAIGAVNAGAFDLGAACSGFVTGLAVASAFIEAGRFRNALVVGADTLARFTDPHDRRTAPIFGDGAGALVLGAGQRGGVQALELSADGDAAGLIATDPATGMIRMEGPETFKTAVATMERSARALCAASSLELSAIDLFVFHQANARITRALVERLDVEPERVVDCIAEVGNTSAASVPLALEHARSEGRLRAGDRILLGAVGAGFTSATALLEWGLPA
jgi:3-oxoacyl-[acyl-carrier-protein] synthase-3